MFFLVKPFSEIAIKISSWTSRNFASGVVVGLSVALYFQKYGFDVSGGGNMSFGGVVMDPVWRGRLNLS